MRKRGRSRRRRRRGKRESNRIYSYAQGSEKGTKEEFLRSLLVERREGGGDMRKLDQDYFTHPSSLFHKPIIKLYSDKCGNEVAC